MAEKPTTLKYLQRYAEPTAHWLLCADADVFKCGYESALVVPVYDETVQRLSAVFSALEIKSDEHGAIPRRLVIVVVNQPFDASPEARNAGQKLLAELYASSSKITRFRSTPLALLHESAYVPTSFDVLVIDATRDEYCLKQKEGVGRARKMGLDAALALQSRGIIRAAMLASTDADAILPVDYFPSLEQTHSGTSALLFPYIHVSTDLGCAPQPMRDVEATFRYYVLGLAYAGSPYAYHSLGSAFAVNGQHYAQVRGVPNRQAGEDFHLLAKLSKLAPLKRMAGQSIRLLTRQSERVPFGTGPSFAQAIFEGHEAGQILTYDPQVFEILRLFLLEMSTWLEDPSSLEESHKGPEARFSQPGEMHAFLCDETNRYRATLASRFSQCPTPQHRSRRFHESFDALATLQFIHRAEAHSLPRLPLEVALDKAPFFHGVASAPHAWLQSQENGLPPCIGPSTGGSPFAPIAIRGEIIPAM